tara:strand:+ start:499 stop:783 length:285 start_codon:yes stop_codon:yes gene_type:complete
MKKSKITIEYDEACLKEQKRVPLDNTKKGRGRPYKYESFKVKNPKAWEIITVENTVEYTPGHRLDKKQMQQLCRSAKYDVQIGMPGQFRLFTKY